MKTEMTIPSITRAATRDWARAIASGWARTCLLAIVPALASASLAEAQTPAEGGLERARALFDKVDLDSDGLVSPREAGRHGIPTRDFVAHDTNRDRHLESEEFVIFYRQLRVKAGKGVKADLEAEAARIQAERRARQAAEARRREAARRTPKPSGGSDPVTVPPIGTPPTVTPPTGGSDADRIAAARKQAQDERIRKAREQAEAERIRKAREQSEQAQADAEAERIRKAREQGQETDADRIAAARRQAEVDRIRRAREQKQKSDADRIAAARRQGQSTPVTAVRKVGLQEVPPSARRQPGNGVGVTPGMTDEQRARAYVQRLVERGRLTPEQARDFYYLLLAPDAPTSDQAKITELRAALKRVRQRIGDLVRKGDLTAEEGRQLSKTFEARAKAALPGDSGPGKRRLDGDKRSGPDVRRVPAGQRTKGKKAGDKQQVGAQRVGEVRKVKPIKVGGTQERKDG